MGEVVGRNSIHVAEYLIFNSRVNLTPIQVNKFAYISHGINLGLHGKSLICEEIEAWRYGPVIPSIYHILKRFQRNTISTKKYLGDHIVIDTYTESNKTFFTEPEIKIMDGCMRKYEETPIGVLIGITHKKGGPWHKYYDKSKSFVKIPNSEIKKYFSNV